MRVLRLIVGLCKGLLLGVLAGWGLAYLGMAAPSAWIAYPVVAALGGLTALVAGKPLWAKDARIEVLLKLAAGVVLAPLLLLGARTLLGFELPFEAAELPGLHGAPAELSVGGFAVTSFALVAALLGGFFEADHDPSDAAAQAGARIAPRADGKRIAAPATTAELDEEAEPEAPRERRRS